MKFEAMFQPIQIGPMTVANRFVMQKDGQDYNYQWQGIKQGNEGYEKSYPTHRELWPFEVDSCG